MTSPDVQHCMCRAGSSVTHITSVLCESVSRIPDLMLVLFGICDQGYSEKCDVKMVCEPQPQNPYYGMHFSAV